MIIVIDKTSLCKHVICVQQIYLIAEVVSVVMPDNFLPFGPLSGDSAVPPVDDGSSQEIQLGTDVIIFGSRNNRLYVSQNAIKNQSV